MQHKKYYFANWKMNVPAEAGAALAAQAKDIVLPDNLELALFPSFLALPAVRGAVGDAVPVGVQDCFWEDKGAFTGEVSPAELNAMGVKYVLVGHSERRQLMGESSEMVSRKVKAALRNGMCPVLCIGETAEDRSSGTWAVFLERELRESLAGVELSGTQKIIIAYEPIWAIGTGNACGVEQAVEAHKLIGNYLHEIFGAARKEEYFAVLYGGSVDAKNIKSYLEREEIAGALVGGASQKWPSLGDCIKALAS